MVLTHRRGRVAQQKRAIRTFQAHTMGCQKYSVSSTYSTFGVGAEGFVEAVEGTLRSVSKTPKRNYSLCFHSALAVREAVADMYGCLEILKSRLRSGNFILPPARTILNPMINPLLVSGLLHSILNIDSFGMLLLQSG
jgi:hypothetical protein